MNAPLTAPSPFPLYRLSVAQYHKMVGAGLFEEDRVELLRGVLVKTMTKRPPHSVCNELVRLLLPPALPPGWHLRGQEPVTFPDSEPEPDGAVVRGHPRDYLGRHPIPGEVALIVEVSDTSLDIDQGVKKELCASAGVPVYWIVNLPDRRLEVYSAPQGNDYTARADLGPDDPAPVVIAGQTVGSVPVRDLLP